jgi:8-amino-7-oxononanoate synthase
MTTQNGPSEASPVSWRDEVDSRCEEIAALGRWRQPRVFDARGLEGVLVDSGTLVVDFASNDYLGLSSHPTVIAAASTALERWGTGTGASRLVTGTRPIHEDLEVALADWKNSPRAVLFPTGFAANLGVLTTFGEKGVLLCSDASNHASIVDGARLARGQVAIYRHADPDHLDALLRECAGRALVVTDTVFSMDGEVAPLADLAAVCLRHRALLVLDEAHNVLGPDPTELVDGIEVLRVGTLSKTLGSLGGFVAGPRRYIELLENTARPYIFTTAPTPADTAAAFAALDIVRSSEGDALRCRLAGYVEEIAPGHPTPIIPVVLGSEEHALAASSELFAQGLFVPAIRPPTVAPGTSRLRVTLSAAHRPAQVERLRVALGTLRSRTARETPGETGGPRA